MNIYSAVTLTVCFCHCTAYNVNNYTFTHVLWLCDSLKLSCLVQTCQTISHCIDVTISRLVMKSAKYIYRSLSLSLSFQEKKQVSSVTVDWTLWRYPGMTCPSMTLGILCKLQQPYGVIGGPLSRTCNLDWPLQDLLSEFVWGLTWPRPTLSSETRSPYAVRPLSLSLSLY